MLEQGKGSPEEEVWLSGRGELRIRRPSRSVLLFIEKGHLDSDFAPKISRACDDAIVGNNRIEIFVDCEFLDGYDPPIRTESTAWLNKHRTSVVKQHMLVRSRLTRMGLAVASLALGGLIDGYSERAPFERALRKAISDTHPPPPI